MLRVANTVSAMRIYIGWKDAILALVYLRSLLPPSPHR